MDVGNSNIVLGLYEGAGAPYAVELAAEWRITTPRASTTDEFGVVLRNLFELNGVALEKVTGIAISSVVPPLDAMLRQVCERYFKPQAAVCGAGSEDGVAGADR